MDSRASSATHRVTNCKTNNLHARTWSPNIKSKISALGIPYIMILAVFWLCLGYIKISQYRNLGLDFWAPAMSI